MLIDEMTTEKIYLPGAPSLPGLTFRSFHGEDDYPIMADVTNACYTADQTGEIVTLGWIARLSIPALSGRMCIYFALPKVSRLYSAERSISKS